MRLQLLAQACIVKTMNSLAIVLPILSLVALGYVLRRQNIIRSSWVDTLNSFVYFIALPALIISSQLSLDLLNVDVLKIIGLNAVIIVLASVLCLIVLKLLPVSNTLRQAMYVSATVGNTVYLGIPLVSRALDIDTGSGSYATLVLISVIQLMVAIACALLGIELMSNRRFNVSKVSNNIIKNPLIISLAAGAMLSLLPESKVFDDIVKTPLVMIAATASPVALITLGAFLRSNHPKQNIWALSFVSLYKLALLPLFAWLIVQASSIGSTYESATILYTSLPVAVTAFVLSKQYKLDSAFVAVAMLVTTVLSSLSVSSVISFVLPG